MFLHGGWDHILGNMLFLAIFIFGLLTARLHARAGQAAPGEQWRSTA
jgi:membrane associated rhomboid family serine protease